MNRFSDRSSGVPLRPRRAIGCRTLLICVALLGAAPANAAARSTRFLVIRYDDYAPVTPYDRGPHGIEIERRLFEMVARHGARIVVGAIPFPAAEPDAPEHSPADLSLSNSWLADPDSSWVRLLRENADRGVVEPALHGFEHRRRTPPGHRPGEFRNQPYDWQLATITIGREALSAAIARPVRVFVPPWNAWDANTAKALAALDFTWLSPDFQHAELPPDTIRVAPQCTADPAETLAWMRDPELSVPGSVMVLVTHPFDFYGPHAEAYFEQLEQLLRFVDDAPDWQVVGFEGLPLETPAASGWRFRDAVAWNHAKAILADLPLMATLGALPSVPYQPRDWYRRHTWRLQWAVAGVMAGSALIGCLLAVLIPRRASRTTAIAWIGAAATAFALIGLLVGGVIIVRHGHLVRGIRWQVASASGGALVGFVILAVRRAAQRVPTEFGGTLCAPNKNNEISIDAT